MVPFHRPGELQWSTESTSGRNIKKRIISAGQPANGAFESPALNIIFYCYAGYLPE